MIQPISGPPPGQPPGQGDNLPSGAGNQSLSSQQRTSLESLMTKVTSLTQQQRAELWAGIRHDIGLSGDSPLLSRHFPAAEHNLAQRLLAAQKSHSARQLLAQLGEYLRLGNNRQAVTDYIRHNFGQTPLNQLSPEQL
ncbi:flagella biosynthesis regulator Flk, partial [Escherichia coli]